MLEYISISGFNVTVNITYWYMAFDTLHELLAVHFHYALNQTTLPMVTIVTQGKQYIEIDMFEVEAMAMTAKV